jgi:hypothetical protein
LCSEHQAPNTKDGIANTDEITGLLVCAVRVDVDALKAWGEMMGSVGICSGGGRHAGSGSGSGSFAACCDMESPVQFGSLVDEKTIDCSGKASREKQHHHQQQQQQQSDNPQEESGSDIDAEGLAPSPSLTAGVEYALQLFEQYRSDTGSSSADEEDGATVQVEGRGLVLSKSEPPLCLDGGALGWAFQDMVCGGHG